MAEQDFTIADVLTPTVGVDPRDAFATSIHAVPGVYAVLVGSGMSTAAGIPTGWQVVLDLIRKVAVAKGAGPEDLGDNPLLWWGDQGFSEPRYDELVAALAPTKHARQLLLRSYFDPGPDQGGPTSPTAAHRVLASLCLQGRVRVILTTNFDRLLEHALEAQGITPQVIWEPSQVAGMTPLVHAPVTIVKLHGDYQYTATMRNTPAELATYPAKWRQLLAQIFDQYGLLVAGWSAEWDEALSGQLRRTPSRRYPTYWISHLGNLSQSAKGLIGLRKASVVEADSADEFFTDLAGRLQRLDQLAARRGRPTLLRTWAFTPDGQTTPPGWALLPLLQVRVAAAITQVTIETCGMIRAKDRQAMVSALREAAVTERLRKLWPVEPASALPDPGPVGLQPLLSDWQATPDAHNSAEQASYRLGTDGSCGISAIATVRLPGVGPGGLAACTLDVALSFAVPLTLGALASLFRDGLTLTTATFPQVFSAILPAEAQVSQAELHVLAASTDGHSSNRPNRLPDRLDLSSLGLSTRAVGPSLGFAVRLSAPLSEREAAELAVEGIEYMALASGYLDPDSGLESVRRELRLGGPS